MKTDIGKMQRESLSAIKAENERLHKRIQELEWQMGTLKGERDSLLDRLGIQRGLTQEEHANNRQLRQRIQELEEALGVGQPDKNRYGLDCRYMREKLGQIMRDMDNYESEELWRALYRLSATVSPAPEGGEQDEAT